MPIEIKELHIRISVNAAAGAPAPGGAGVQAGQNAGQTEAARDALVAECVEQVMEVLRHKSER